MSDELGRRPVVARTSGGADTQTAAGVLEPHFADLVADRILSIHPFMLTPRYGAAYEVAEALVATAAALQRGAA